MKVCDEDFLILQAIHRCSVLGYPCPAETVAKAAGFIEAGLVGIKGEVAKDGVADLFVTDDAKWKLLAGGRKLKS